MTTRGALRRRRLQCSPGNKMWISNSPIADVFPGVGEDRRRRHSRFHYSRKGMRGLSAPRIEGKFSLRTSITGEIVMDDVVRARGKPAAQCRGPQGPVRLPEQCTLRHRLGRAGRGGILLARGAPIRARSHAVRAAAGGKSADSEKLADMQTDITLGTAGCLRLGRLMDEAVRRRR